MKNSKPKNSKLKRPALSKLSLPSRLPALPATARRTLRRGKGAEEKMAEALKSVPRITNETVSEHREEVLSGARKYIYPLQHSKHRIVRVSISLLAAAVIIFFVYCGLALYKFQSTSGFVYGVTQVIPFPVAKAGGSWVSYEAYLFELKRNMHYYQVQQQSSFSTKDGKEQLRHLKQQAMTQVIQDAYVKQLAAQNHVSVSDQAVNNEITLVRVQNRLGNSDQIFKDVLNQFWGWNENDFKRELKQQLLQQAVVAKLDTQTDQRAAQAYKALQSGQDFGALAAQDSDDASTKGNGGQYATAITQTDRDVAPQVTNALFHLKAGQTSAIINTGYSLEILKVISSSGGSVQAAHIQFNFKDITTYTKPLQAKHPSHQYIRF